MPRARNIKPAVMADDVLAELGPFTRLLHIVCLPMLADREGRLEDRPKKIRGEAFPYEKKLDIEKMLVELFDHGYIDRYSVGSRNIIQLLDFPTVQSPHGTEKDSLLPDRTGILTVHERTLKGYATGKFKSAIALTVKDQVNNSAAQVSPPVLHSLIPDPGSQNPDVLIPDTLAADVDNSDSVCVVLIDHEIQYVNAKDSRFQSLVGQDSSEALWKEAANIARSKNKTTFEYVMGIVGNKLDDRSTKQNHQYFTVVNQTANPRKQMEDRAEKVGIGKWQQEENLRYEHWHIYCSRVTEAEEVQKVG